VATRRTYADRCGIARALDIVGERWALLIARELLLGPKRFTDLQAGLSRVSPDILSERLRELRSTGVVHRRRLGPPAGSWVYELTDWGHDLEPLLIQLGRWGSRAPLPSGDTAMSADSVILGLQTQFDPHVAEGLTVTCEMWLGDDVFHAHVADGGIDVGRGSARRPDVVIHTDPGTLEALLWHNHPVTQAQRAGAIIVEGDGPLLERFLSVFPIPEPVGVSSGS
jgi:DNA-binding HxlR family transcriptional regulator